MAEKARTPMSGAEREAKYAAKMKEKDYETWWGILVNMVMLQNW